MTTCEFESRLSAYHDNELSPADRAVVESHLQGCGQCQAALAAIREMSGLFVASAPAPLSQIARHRLHRQADRQMERGLVRLSWMMSGIAAAVMVIGTLWLQSADQPTIQTTTGTQITFGTEASTPAEQYYLADATIRSQDW